MKKIIVDGSFIEKRVTGVGRFSWETLRALSKVSDLKVYLAIPESTDEKLCNFENIEIIKEGKKNNKFWQFFTLKKISRRLKAPLLCTANFSPLFQKDYVVLHDVTFLDREGKNRFLWSLFYRIFIGFNISKHKTIFTVSDFSKKRILEHYKKVKSEQVVVLGNGGEHLKVLSEEPFEHNFDNFFLSVGSTTNNKNFDYIIALAKNNPNRNFIVVGRIDGDYRERVKSLTNILFTGYLENSKLIFLYRTCRGFILPSFYEGFGIPPLEALNCGCKCLLLSDIEVFHEVYGDAANYFDPYDYENTIDLENLKEASEEEIERITRKYSWENIARVICEHITEKD